MEEQTLNRLAAEEILRESQRAADRAASFGATAWQRNPVPKHNKNFLTRAISGALTQNAWLTAKAQKKARSPCGSSHGSAASPRRLLDYRSEENDTMIDNLHLRDSDMPSCSKSLSEERREEFAGRSPRKHQESPSKHKHSPSKQRKFYDRDDHDRSPNSSRRKRSRDREEDRGFHRDDYPEKRTSHR